MNNGNAPRLSPVDFVELDKSSLTGAKGGEMTTTYFFTYIKDSWIKRIVGAALFWLYIGFLVWLSLGSTFWTFIFGTLAMVSMATRVLLKWKEYHHSFSTKQRLLMFVQGLPDDKQ